MEEKKRCPGCGAVFQTADENLPGFLAPHYGVFRKALISDPNIQKELRRQADSCAALFLVLDVTRPEISMSDLDWAEELNKPVFLVANKVDLLEPWAARKEVLAWLSEQSGVPAEQIFLISAHSRRDMTDLRARLRDTFSPEDRILFAGAANVGKSTILGALLKNDLPTVSRRRGKAFRARSKCSSLDRRSSSAALHSSP